MSRRDEVAGAFMLLTRLPVGGLARGQASPASCVWAYPLVGAVVGGIAAATYAAAGLVVPPGPAALLAVAASILATGGLHEDGLADTADGFGGGTDAARKLEIMRDSRIGSFGAVALILSIGLRVSALSSLAMPAAAVALVAAGTLGRGAMLVPLWRLAPARAGGLAAPLAAASRGGLALGLGLAALVGVARPTAVAASLLAGFGMAALARRQVGGYTGDVLGATEQIGECAALLAMGYGPG